jgi:hypothetical protein
VGTKKESDAAKKSNKINDDPLHMQSKSTANCNHRTDSSESSPSREGSDSRTSEAKCQPDDDWKTVDEILAEQATGAGSSQSSDSPQSPPGADKSSSARREPKVARRKEYSPEFSAFWSAWSLATNRSPGTKEKAATQFGRLSAVDRDAALRQIDAYMADCARDFDGRGRPAKDAERYLKYRLFEQVAEEAVPRKQADDAYNRFFEEMPA